MWNLLRARMRARMWTRMRTRMRTRMWTRTKISTTPLTAQKQHSTSKKNKKIPPTFPKAGKISGNFPKSSQKSAVAFPKTGKNQRRLSRKQAKINTNFRNSHRRRTRENFCLSLLKTIPVCDRLIFDLLLFKHNKRQSKQDQRISNKHKHAQTEG